MKNKILLILLLININDLRTKDIKISNKPSKLTTNEKVTNEKIENETILEIKNFLKSNKSKKEKIKDKLKKQLKDHIKYLQKEKINLNKYKYIDLIESNKDYYLTLMQLSALIGDVDSVSTLIKDGVDPNKTNNKFNTPLHYTTDSKIAKILINQNIDLNTKNYLGDTPLHKASKYGNDEVLQVLIQNQAKINEKNYTDRTALHLAIETNNNPIAIFLINNGANINENTNSLKYTPLHTAIIAFNIEIIQLLLDKNADTSLKDIYGNSQLELLNNLDKLQGLI